MLSFSHGFGWAFQETRGTAIWPASHSLSKTSLRQAIPLSYPVQRIFVSCFQVRKGIGPSKWAKNPWGYSTVIMLPHIHSIIFVWLRFDLGRGLHELCTGRVGQFGPFSGQVNCGLWLGGAGSLRTVEGIWHFKSWACKMISSLGRMVIAKTAIHSCLPLLCFSWQLCF